MLSMDFHSAVDPDFRLQLLPWLKLQLKRKILNQKYLLLADLVRLAFLEDLRDLLLVFGDSVTMDCFFDLLFDLLST
jgi:hypothetical protein